METSTAPDLAIGTEGEVQWRAAAAEIVAGMAPGWVPPNLERMAGDMPAAIQRYLAQPKKARTPYAVHPATLAYCLELVARAQMEVARVRHVAEGWAQLASTCAAKACDDRHARIVAERDRDQAVAREHAVALGLETVVDASGKRGYVLPVAQGRVFAEIAIERVRQDAKWGPQNHDPLAWMAILVEEVGEASQAAVEAWAARGGLSGDMIDAYRGELIQAAAVAVAMVEAVDRHTWQWPTYGGAPVMEDVAPPGPGAPAGTPSPAAIAAEADGLRRRLDAAIAAEADKRVRLAADAGKADA